MSSYGKCMVFPINFPQYRKMQQNPCYGESLGNWYSYFPHSMVAFFPLGFHPVVYFIIWKMHGFPHQFPKLRENARKKPRYRESLGNLNSCCSHSVVTFFPLDSHPMAYFIIWENMGFAITFPHFRKMQQNPSYGENLGNWYSYSSHNMSAFSH